MNANRTAMQSLGTSRVAVKSLGRVWDEQDSCEVSRTSLDTSRIAVKSLGRVDTSRVALTSLGRF